MAVAIMIPHGLPGDGCCALEDSSLPAAMKFPKQDWHPNVSQNVIMNAGGGVGVQTLFDMVKSLACCGSQPEVLHLLKISKVRALQLL